MARRLGLALSESHLSLYKFDFFFRKACCLRQIFSTIMIAGGLHAADQSEALWF